MKRVHACLAAAVVLFTTSCGTLFHTLDKDEVWTPVEIHFTGICTLYDEKGWQSVEKSLTMLLVNADAPTAVLGHGGIERHVPFLVFSDQSLDLRHGRQLFRMTNPKKNDEPSWRYEPRGEELFLDPAATIDPATLWYKLDGDSDDANKRQQCPATDEDRESLHWIPRMKYVLGEEIMERDSYVEAPRQDPAGAPHPDPNRVAARFVIAGGRLRAARFMSDTRQHTATTPPVILWNFKQRLDDQPRHSQAMAQEVVWSFLVKGDRLTLYRRPFDAPLRVEKALTFKPDDEGNIVIRVGNTRPADVLPEPGGGHFMERDHHFALYYRFVLNVDVPAVVPFSDGGYCSDRKGGFGSVDGLNCGPNRLP